jgi:bifunctional N-acetylglucosamine-1-phosphate-uridyltransferase/glucosamine-1-phosphate-acetyltransferase GlmU-like protein
MRHSNSVAIILANSSDLEGKESLEILDNLSSAIESVSFVGRVILVASEFVNETLVKGGMNFSHSFTLIKVPTTRGALATLCLGIHAAGDTNDLLVVPVNCLVEKSAIEKFLNHVQSNVNEIGILAINSTDPIYSYARVTQSGKIIEIIEKRVTGDLALSGIFYFRSAKSLLACATWSFKNNLSTKGQFYIAPSLNYFIAKGESFGVVMLESDAFTRI